MIVNYLYLFVKNLGFEPHSMYISDYLYNCNLFFYQQIKFSHHYNPPLQINLQQKRKSIALLKQSLYDYFSKKKIKHSCSLYAAVCV